MSLGLAGANKIASSRAFPSFAVVASNRNLDSSILLPGMTQYFFDFRSGGVVSTDDEGQELPDVEAAHNAAIEALADALQDIVLQGQVDQRVVIDVRDDLGPVLEVTAIFGSKILRKQ